MLRSAIALPVLLPGAARFAIGQRRIDRRQGFPARAESWSGL